VILQFFIYVLLFFSDVSIWSILSVRMCRWMSRLLFVCVEKLVHGTHEK
jgi:hypothetical protein